jgi:membrane associated rhomboid family serine protease
MFTVTLSIIVVTCLVSIAAFGNYKIREDLLFWPAAMKGKQLHRFLTHGFVHGDYLHLAFNMITLWSFGRSLEGWFLMMYDQQGKLLYILLYILGIIVSSLPDYFKHRDHSGYRALGASGAVMAVIFVNIILDPLSKLSLFFIPVRIPAFIMGILFLVISVYLARRGRDNIGHSAHITGAIFGVIYIVVVAKLMTNLDVLQLFFRRLQDF